jgi:hypothetical protein
MLDHREAPFSAATACRAAYAQKCIESMKNSSKSGFNTKKRPD